MLKIKELLNESTIFSLVPENIKGRKKCQGKWFSHLLFCNEKHKKKNKKIYN